jgi:ATP synthase subunit K
MRGILAVTRLVGGWCLISAAATALMGATYVMFGRDLQSHRLSAAYLSILALAAGTTALAANHSFRGASGLIRVSLIAVSTLFLASILAAVGLSCW